jgi:hypothetical protein
MAIAMPSFKLFGKASSNKLEELVMRAEEMIDPARREQTIRGLMGLSTDTVLTEELWGLTSGGSGSVTTTANDGTVLPAGPTGPDGIQNIVTEELSRLTSGNMTVGPIGHTGERGMIGSRGITRNLSVGTQTWIDDSGYPRQTTYPVEYPVQYGTIYPTTYGRISNESKRKIKYKK